MRTLFSGARVAGLLGVLPGRRIDFADEAAAYPFPLAQTLRLQRVMGYGSRRVVREGTTPSDLCRAGMERIFREGWARREEIAGLIVATSCPDQLIPPVSSLLHGALGLPREAVCLDLSQGCTGFLAALIQGLMLLPHVEGKVLAASADVLSRRTSPKDRNSAPLAGDGAGLPAPASAALPLVQPASREHPRASARMVLQSFFIRSSQTQVGFFGARCTAEQGTGEM